MPGADDVPILSAGWGRQVPLHGSLALCRPSLFPFVRLCVYGPFHDYRYGTANSARRPPPSLNMTEYKE
ncbi:hypothetical protein RRG08_042670 [Elysia crispata]|uniref:Uncharacterized protein n=1 Tax=Elysia crispata TaxID=231223 RepID=A0AAE1CKE3_9GAST|nr:hypothetical protein RRG08_042670 [Elysia crispata]